MQANRWFVEHVEHARGAVSHRARKLDEVHIIYTRMVNAMKMEAEMEQLLPLKRLSFSVPANVPLEEINQRGTTMIVVTHSHEMVQQMKKRVITMERGAVIQDEGGSR